MFVAMIDTKTTVMRIEPGFLDSELENIALHLKSDGPVILDTDNNRLEAMASQMGLAVTYDDVLIDKNKRFD